MRRFFKWFGVVLVALWGGLYIYPWIDTKPEQDDCSFGSVTNEQYRELLAEAERLRDAEWLPMTDEVIRAHIENRSTRERFEEKRLGLGIGMTDGLSNFMAARLRTMVLKQDSVEKQIAASHAVMRASGFLLINGYKGDRRSANPRLNFNSSVSYVFDVNRLGRYFPLYRWVRVSLSLKLDPDLPYRRVTNVTGYGSRDHPAPPRLHIGVLPPNFIEGFTDKQFYFGDLGCPRIPTAVLVSSYSLSTQQ